jgi:pyruvate kinase
LEVTVTTPRRRTATRIVATLGPSSWEPEVLPRLIDAGADVFRINASHADAASIRRQVARVRTAAFASGVPIAILLDLQGPKIRTSKVESPLELAPGDVLTIVMREDLLGTGHRVGTTYPEMADDVQPGDRVLFADGALSGEVAAVRREARPFEVDIRMIDGGKLGSNKGINLPGVKMSVPSLTDKDLADVEVGVECGVDYIALSFVRHENDVVGLRERLRQLGTDIPIIAKIEKPEALVNLDAILDVSDGVMVARGDLGVEVPLEQVPIHQKRIIAAAARKGKLVITATQMLDSMERNPRPTRAETTDVANAILDGTDAVMLSGETSVGPYAIEAVATMDAIAREIEAAALVPMTPTEALPAIEGPAGAACKAACFTIRDRTIPVVVFSWSGATVRYLSRVRPRAPIYAFSPNPPVVDRLALAWGVESFLMPLVHTIDEMVAVGERTLLERGLVQAGDALLILGGNSPRQGTTCFLKFHVVGQP